MIPVKQIIFKICPEFYALCTNIYLYATNTNYNLQDVSEVLIRLQIYIVQQSLGKIFLYYDMDKIFKFILITLIFIFVVDKHVLRVSVMISELPLICLRSPLSFEYHI